MTCDDCSGSTHGQFLDMSDAKLKEIPIVDNADEIRSVDFSCNEISSVDNLSQFKKVHTITLDGNKISSSTEFPTMPTVTMISLSKNSISDIQPFINQMSEKFTNLSTLLVLKNPGIPNVFTPGVYSNDYKRFRVRLVAALPKLKVIDSSPVTAEEQKEAAAIKPIRMSTRKKIATRMKIVDLAPSPMAPPGKTAVETCKYVYHGRASEGNRYIREGDL